MTIFCVGGELIALGLQYGAGKASNVISWGAKEVQNRITPTEENPKVNPQLQQSLSTARSVTKDVRKVSGYAGNTL